jgi:hypothetical protein
VGGATTLYVVDAALNALFTQGSVNSSPTSPNTGTLLNQVPLSGIAAGNVTGFDISGTTGTAFVATDTGLFSLNLSTGAATSLGNFAGGLSVVNLTAVPEPGSLALCGMAAAGLIGLARRRRKKEEKC